MTAPAHRLPNHPRHQMMNNPYLQSSAANYLPHAAAHYRRWPAFNSPLYLSLHSPNIALHLQDETAIIGGTGDYRSNAWYSYNQPSYEGTLELEEQMGRVDSRFVEETVIIESTYDYLPIRAHSIRSRLYNQPTYEDETAIMGGTGDYRSNPSHLYNLPGYEGSLELEEQMEQVDSRFLEETVIIEPTYDYLPIQAHSIRSRLYNQPTYEENLELEEQMGRVDSRLSEETIMGHLKGEYEKDELIGGLQCRHEYHVECVKKWLQQHNSCPICKADAVSLST
ncbi:uncharacterized protein LOC108226879 isoform X2 [Daucus carota subsp. sativus]|uniref:uncharacterized protein LOC108226879 isoform X2 n=1 Tax=Daucus carota subsp. sativus TaxID=79200 RepID=UPI0007EF70BC|nr:PREDICTED: uncharacterized protein LOC108226879 isoform X2 [Daucus carota subsp. sativus]